MTRIVDGWYFVVDRILGGDWTITATPMSLDDPHVTPPDAVVAAAAFVAGEAGAKFAQVLAGSTYTATPAEFRVVWKERTP